MRFTEKKFRSLAPKAQHLKAAQLLKTLWHDWILEKDAEDLVLEYMKMCLWCGWDPLPLTEQAPYLHSNLRSSDQGEALYEGQLSRNSLDIPQEEAPSHLFKYGALNAQQTTNAQVASSVQRTSLLADRFHWHSERSGRGVREESLLPPIKACGKAAGTTTTSRLREPLSNFDAYAQRPAPFLPITLYLDRVRSAHNVGSIARTTEALRLGELVFPPQATALDHPQAQRTSMECSGWVPWMRVESIQECRRPWIALENHPKSCDLSNFQFPPSFTLIVGNEEEGVSDSILSKADHCVKIPLFGRKNCLNVANAFAICAQAIRQQYPPPTKHHIDFL